MLQANTPVYMLYDAETSYFKPMILIADSPVRTSVVECKCYCGSKGSSKPPCMHNMRCICFKTGRDSTNVCRFRGCGNKHPVVEGREKHPKCIRHKLVVVRTQVGEDELQLIKPPSTINSLEYCILESLLFYCQRLKIFVVSG